MTDIKPVGSFKEPWMSHVVSAGTQISNELSQWFRLNQRDLKFRKTLDPYAIMVSEFMLQQTTVTAVQPYYERFMAQYPTVQDLSAATEDEVMFLWAGLGYYRRARQLLAASKIIVNDFGGIFPRDAAMMEKLPGFGKYTAGAVISAAFNTPAPILESNTIRVFSRIPAIKGTVGDSGFMKILWEVSRQLVHSARSPREFNMAAMELGAIICRPVPRCDICPIQHHCLAYRMNVQLQIPAPRPRPATVTRTLITFVVQDKKHRFLLRRIPQGEWHAGMWEFPSQMSETSEPEISQVSAFATSWFGNSGVSVERFTTLKYQVTHHKVTCHVFRCHDPVSLPEIAAHGSEFTFVSLEEMETFALGSAQKKLYRLLKSQPGNPE